MPMHLASLYGACMGLLAGVVIALLFNLDMADSIYRTGILTLCGAWMGLLLAWLNTLLPDHSADKHQSAQGNAQGNAQGINRGTNRQTDRTTS